MIKLNNNKKIIKKMDNSEYFGSEDVEIVCKIVGCTKKEAIKTLILVKGDLARAILSLTSS